MKYYLFIFILFITFTCTGKENLTILHGPFIQHPSDTGVTIIWTTNKNAVSWVEVTSDHNDHLHKHKSRKYFSVQYELKEPTTVHSVRINNLNAGTSYSYIVYSQTIPDKFNTYNDKTIAASSLLKYKPLKFSTTNSATENQISFLAVNDIHGHHCQLKNLLKKADYHSADFVVFNGDMIQNMKNENQFFNGFMNMAIRMFAREKPLYYARGNHETLGDYAPAFDNYFKSPDGKLYFLLRRGPICFLILDSGEYLDDHVIDDHAEKKFDLYRNRESAWLSEAIKTKDFREATFRVAIIHVPPIGVWHGAVEVATKFVPLLNKANIDMMICGHLHRYFYRKPDDEINFPVLVNSNNTVVRAEADASSMTLKIINRKGKMVGLIEVKK